MTLELLSSRVSWLEESKSDWEALCREMLVTITLEGNKEFFAPLDETWTNTVDAWVDRFHAIEAAEQSVQRTAGFCAIYRHFPSFSSFLV